MLVDSAAPQGEGSSFDKIRLSKPWFWTASPLGDMGSNKLNGKRKMIKGNHVLLRPIQTEDWDTIETWGKDQNALWGPFQRFQLDHVPQLRQAFEQMGLLSRAAGFLLVETIQKQEIIGFVRYTLIPYPDADTPYPEIGFGIPEISAQGKGFAKEAVKILVDYLFAGYPVERIMAFTDAENLPAQRVLEKNGFQQEGRLRRSIFRAGQWCDTLIYGVLRQGAQLEEKD
jgi:aminoglycoside 6'-N-acetyltransferase